MFANFQVTVSVENGEAEDQESISIAMTLFYEAVSSADEETLDKNDRKRISFNVRYMAKAKMEESQEGESSSRQRRAVVGETPIIVEKNEEQVFAFFFFIISSSFFHCKVNKSFQDDFHYIINLVSRADQM